MVRRGRSFSSPFTIAHSPFTLLPLVSRHPVGYHRRSSTFMVTPSQSENTGSGRAPLRAVENILELVGGTPLLRLSRFAPPPAAELYAKLEYMNPGGSVKDRAALGMILDAERRGVLEPGATVIEPTAGNTGIGLALVGAARGYRVVLCVPEGYSREKMKIMEALGGRVEYVPAEEGMEGAVRRARELAAETPGSFIPQQFENPANPRFHRETTAREIIEQTDGRIDALVLGCGSTGAAAAAARKVAERLGAGRRVVTLFPDGAERYMSQGIFD